MSGRRHARYYRASRLQRVTDWIGRKLDGPLARRLVRGAIAKLPPYEQRAIRELQRLAGSELSGKVLQELANLGAMPYRLAKHIWESGRE